MDCSNCLLVFLRPCCWCVFSVVKHQIGSFSAPISIMAFTAQPSAERIEREITYQEYNKPKGVVIHFLGHGFISRPCCALCAFDIMVFMMRVTGEHVYSSHYCWWICWFYWHGMIGVIFMSLSPVRPLSAAVLKDFLSEIFESISLPPAAPDWLAHFLHSYREKRYI